MTKNIYTILFFMILLMPFCFSYTLIDSENFESYTVYTIGTPNSSLFTESSGKWNCSNPALYPDCSVLTGALQSGMVSGFNIAQLNNSKFLKVWTLNGQSAPLGYLTTSLKWNNDNVSVDVNSSITLRFKMLINSDTNSFSNFIGTDNRYNYGGIIEYAIPRGATKETRTLSGGLASNTWYNHSRLRTYYDTALTEMYPLNSDCVINDGDWHVVTKVFIFGGKTGVSVNLTSIETYIDSQLCHTDTSNYASFGVPPIDAIYNLYFTTSGGYEVWYDDIELYEGINRPNAYTGLIDILNCPYSNCIFYDNFHYDDYHNLSLEDYELETDSAIIKTWKLFLNSSYPEQPIIYHDTIEHSYNKVTSLVKFYINSTKPTPESLEDDFISYYFAPMCNDLEAGFYTLYFFRDDDWTLSENRTGVNLYTLKDGNINLLGTFTINNGQYFYIRFSTDNDIQKGYLTIIRQYDIETGFTPENEFSVDYITSCNNIDGFSLSRLDYLNEVNYGYIGIQEISMFGGFVYDDDTQDEFIFEYTNQTNQSNAIVKTEVGEQLQNASFSLGFKSEASRILFWFLIMFIFIFLLANSNIEIKSKTFIIPIVSIVLFIVGFRYKFIPVSLFAFVIFIVAIIGAIVLQRIFQSPQT